MTQSQKIVSMRAAGKILASTFLHISEFIKEGASAYQIDQLAQSFIESQQAFPGFLGYQGYKYSTCISKK